MAFRCRLLPPPAAVLATLLKCCQAFRTSQCAVALAVYFIFAGTQDPLSYMLHVATATLDAIRGKQAALLL